MKNVSLAKRSLLRALLFFMCGGFAIFLLGYAPHDDLIQAVIYTISGIVGAYKLYLTDSRAADFEERHKSRADKLVELWKESEGYRLSNLLSAGDVPLWQFVQVFWEKFSSETDVKETTQDIAKYLNKSVSELEKYPIDVLKMKAIGTILTNAHLVDLIVPSACRPGEHIHIFSTWVAEAKDLSLSQINDKLYELGEAELNKCEKIEGAENCYIAEVPGKRPSPWTLNYHFDINVIAGTKMRPVKSASGVSFKPGLRVAFAEKIFTEEMGEKLLSRVKLFQPQWGGVVLKNREDHMTGFFINDNETLTPDQIAEAIREIKALAVELWPTPVSKEA